MFKVRERKRKGRERFGGKGGEDRLRQHCILDNSCDCKFVLISGNNPVPNTHTYLYAQPSNKKFPKLYLQGTS